jgi:hypothetical protein
MHIVIACEHNKARDAADRALDAYCAEITRPSAAEEDGR